TLNLAAASDSGTVGDLRTDASTVNLTGTAEAGSTVTLFDQTVPGVPGTGAVVATTTAANGTFTFNVPLAIGPNSFVVRATDAAGNASATFAQTFTRNTPPTAGTVADRNLSATTPTSTVELDTVYSDAERVPRIVVQSP